MKRFGFTLLLAAAVAVLAVPANAGDDTTMADLAKRWMDSFNAGDDAAIAAMYVEDGCRMPPNAETATGREAIAANIAGAREMGAAKAQIAVTMSSTSGDEGHGMGTFALLDAQGDEIDRGKWMNVVKKVEGQWMIVCDIWNSDLPPPMADDGAGDGGGDGEGEGG